MCEVSMDNGHYSSSHSLSFNSSVVITSSDHDYGVVGPQDIKHAFGGQLEPEFDEDSDEVDASCHMAAPAGGKQHLGGYTPMTSFAPEPKSSPPAFIAILPKPAPISSPQPSPAAAQGLLKLQRLINPGGDPTDADHVLGFPPSLEMPSSFQPLDRDGDSVGAADGECAALNVGHYLDNVMNASMDSNASSSAGLQPRFHTPSYMEGYGSYNDGSERSYICNLCGKGFQKPSHLTRHKMIHTAERKFKCEHCEKDFYRRDKYNEHQKMHARKRCKACGMMFPKKSDLFRHMQETGHQIHSSLLLLDDDYPSGTSLCAGTFNAASAFHQAPYDVASDSQQSLDETEGANNSGGGGGGYYTSIVVPPKSAFPAIAGSSSSTSCRRLNGDLMMDFEDHSQHSDERDIPLGQPSSAEIVLAPTSPPDHELEGFSAAAYMQSEDSGAPGGGDIASPTQTALLSAPTGNATPSALYGHGKLSNGNVGRPPAPARGPGLAYVHNPYVSLIPPNRRKRKIRSPKRLVEMETGKIPNLVVKRSPAPASCRPPSTPSIAVDSPLDDGAAYQSAQPAAYSRRLTPATSFADASECVGACAKCCAEAKRATMLEAQISELQAALSRVQHDFDSWRNREEEEDKDLSNSEL